MAANLIAGRFVGTAVPRSFGATFSAECWFRLRSGVSTSQYLLAFNNASGGVYTIVNIRSSLLETWIAASAAAVRTATTTLQAGVLYHACVTSDGTAAGTRVYLNGVSEGVTGAAIPGTPSHTGVFAIGGKEASSAVDRNLVDGQIGLVRVYDVVLTPTEVANRYADPATYDYVTSKAANLCVRADLEDDLVVRNGVDATTVTLTAGTGTTAALTASRSLATGIPPPIAIYKPGEAQASGYNQLTSNRLTTLGDYSDNGMSAVESGGLGMTQVAVDGLLQPKINVAHIAATPSAARYYNKAAGSGHTFDSRAFTVVAWLCPRSSIPLNGTATSGNTGHETILSIGNPTGSAGTSIFDVVMDGRGRLVSCRTNDPTVDAVTSDMMFPTARPRMIAIASDASGRTLQVDSVRKTGAAIASATATGLRIGAEVGALVNYSQFDIYRIELHARKLSNAELDALYAAGKTPFKYQDATRFLWIRGSSTVEGYSFNNLNENLVSQFQDHGENWIIVSHARSGEYRANFIANYANEGSGFAAAVLAGYPSATRGSLHALIQYLGNDYVEGLTRGNYATISSEYSAWFHDIEAEFGTLSLFVPVVRTSYALDTQDEEREQFVQDFKSQLGTLAGRTVVDRVAQLTPDSGAYADLIFISRDLSLYENDETHLKNTTTRLFRQSLQEFLDGLEAPTAAPTYLSVVPDETTVGGVVVTVEGVIGRVRVYSSATSGGARTLRGDSTTNVTWNLVGSVGTMSIDGLIEATEYYFTATNEDVDLGLTESVVSDENRATAGWDPPQSAGTSVTAVGTNRIELTIAAGWFGTAYFEYRLFGSSGAWTYAGDETSAPFVLNGDNSGTFKYSTGLLPNTKYSLRARSFITDPDSGVDSLYNSVGASDVFVEKMPPTAPRVDSVQTGAGTLKVVVGSGFVGRVRLYTSSTLNGTYTELKSSLDPEWSTNPATGQGTFNVTGLSNGNYYVRVSNDNFPIDGTGAESDLSSPAVLGVIDGEETEPQPTRPEFLLYH